MKRKVSKIGPATLMVSLPSKWVKRYGVKKGDEVEVEEKEGSLRINTSNVKEDIKKIRLDIKNKNPLFIRWMLYNLHKGGYDEAELLFDDSFVSKVIQENVRSLIGYAIIEQTDKRILLKNISKVLETEFEPALRRYFLVSLSVAETSLDLIKNDNLKGLEEVLALEKTVNEFANFCERIIIKYKYPHNDKTCFIYVIVWQIEKIIDDVRDMLKLIISSKLKIEKQSLNCYQKICDIFRKYYELYYEFEENKASSIVENCKSLDIEIIKIIKSTKEPQNLLVLNYLSRINQRILELIPSTFGLWIKRT